MEKFKLKKVVSPLRLIFWGGLICSFDFNIRFGIGTWSINFNILNDLIGVILILIGTIILSNLDIGKVYNFDITLVVIFSLGWFSAVFLGVTIEGFKEFIFPIWQYLRYLGPIGMLVFCFAMLDLSKRYCSVHEVSSWKKTTYSFIFFAILPSFCFWTFGLFIPNHGELVWTYFAYGLSVGYLIALLQFFLSISTMVRRSKSRDLLAPETGAI